MEEPCLLAGAGRRRLQRALTESMRGDPDPGGRPTGQAPASAHAAGPLLSGAHRAGTQPTLRLTHREGPARGPAQHWCTAPPARSAPPSTSPSCRRQSPLTSATGLRLPPVPSPTVHRAALPGSTNRSRAQLDHQAKAIEGPRRALRSSSLLLGSGLERSWSVESPDSRHLCSKDENTREALCLTSVHLEEGMFGIVPFSIHRGGDYVKSPAIQVSKPDLGFQQS